MKHSSRFSKSLLVLAALWLLASVFVASPPVGYAASAAQGWSPPQVVSTEGAYAQDPTIATDATGKVHLLWVEKMDRNSQCPWDTVFYASDMDSTWTAPVDILISPGQKCAQEPALAIERSDNRLSVVWSDGYNIYFSSAPAETADKATAWQSPVHLDPTNAKRPAIAVDSAGRIHIVYRREFPDWDIGYIRSDDGGQTWTPPQRLHSAPSSYRTESIELAMDGNDRVHLVWTYESNAPGMSRGGMVLYSRSTDAGTTWQEPVIVDQKDDRYRNDYGAGEITVATVGLDGVHLAWAGAPTGNRWHQWSSDGGATWHSAQLVAPLEQDLRYFNGGLSMTADSLGRVHLLSSSLTLSHWIWNGMQWSLIEDLLPFSPYGPRMAIANGNELFVTGAFLSNPTGLETVVPVWVMRSTTDAPFVAPMVSTVEPTPTAEAKGAAATATTAIFYVTPTPSATPTALSPNYDGISPVSNQRSNSLSVLLVGFLASASVVIVAVGAQRRLRRHRR